MTALSAERQYEQDGVECVSCAGRSFRRSRVKFGDLFGLLLLRYPVRCMACSMRQTVPLSVAMDSLSSRARTPRDSPSSHEVTLAEGSTPPGGAAAMPDLRGIKLESKNLLPEQKEPHS